jgi:hypothetical protein
MAFEAKDRQPSQRLAIESIADKFGRAAETLRRCEHLDGHDIGVRTDPRVAKQQCIKELERELRKAAEILKLAGACFGQARHSRGAAR